MRRSISRQMQDALRKSSRTHRPSPNCGSCLTDTRLYFYPNGAQLTSTHPRARLFYRIDDIGEEATCDIEIIETLEALRVPYILAIIPLRLSDQMMARVRNLNYSEIFQHGFAHTNASLNTSSDEFPCSTVYARKQLAEGKAHLENRLGRPINGYTPPWNNTSEPILRLLQEIGFRWFSGHVRHVYRTTMLQLNVSIDPVTQYRPPCLSQISDLHRRLAVCSSKDARIGIVLHPKIYPESYRKALKEFLCATASGAFSIAEWRELLNTF